LLVYYGVVIETPAPDPAEAPPGFASRVSDGDCGSVADHHRGTDRNRGRQGSTAEK